MKPTFLAWAVTGLFLAAMVAILVLSYSPSPMYLKWCGGFIAALIGLVALHLHSDQAKK